MLLYTLANDRYPRTHGEVLGHLETSAKLPLCFCFLSASISIWNLLMSHYLDHFWTSCRLFSFSTHFALLFSCGFMVVLGLLSLSLGTPSSDTHFGI